MRFAGEGKGNMRVEPIAYMEWAKLHHKAKINLSRSALADRSLAELGLDLAELDINGENAYGYPPLVNALSSRFGVLERNIFTTGGASQAIFMVCAALLEPGDRVLVEKPAYEPLLAAPRFFRAEIRRIERRIEEGYGIDLDRFRVALAAGPKLVLLTNLHNPSGVRLPAATLGELAAAAAERGAMVFVDEIYLEYATEKGGETAFHLGENIIAASSLTKVYGLGGLRCGWVFGPLPLVEKLRRLADHMNVVGVFIGEQISAQILARLNELAAENRPLIRKNLGLVRNFMRRELNLSWAEPAPGIICFPRIEAAVDGTQLAAVLEKNHETTIVPGHFFEEPRHFRLGFGGPSDHLAEGLENIHKALASL
jgi:aspartate/methionine/tyrosine aminotransferase